MAPVSKILRSFHITPSQDTDLAILSAELGVPKSELVREGIDLILDKHVDRMREAHAAAE